MTSAECAEELPALSTATTEYVLAPAAAVESLKVKRPPPAGLAVPIGATVPVRYTSYWLIPEPVSVEGVKPIVGEAETGVAPDGAPGVVGAVLSMTTPATMVVFVLPAASVISAWKS